LGEPALKEYVTKGLAMNDELLKIAVGGNYFDEFLARIRDIRSSEKMFSHKVLDIYATSIGYDPCAESSQAFFQTVQNKMHYAAHSNTAAELIFHRDDGDEPFSGFTAWRVHLPSERDSVIAKTT
jgi:hypothetical protein